MKTKFLSTTFFKVIVMMLLITSCSDDNPLTEDSQNPPDNSNGHTYNLTFSGGDVDGHVFSGNFADNTILAVWQHIPDGEGGLDDVISLAIAEESQSNNFGLGMGLLMNGNVPIAFGEGSSNENSHMVITYDNYILIVVSGAITMTNLGEIEYQGITYPHFKITYSATLNGSNTDTGNQFSTDVTGEVIVKPPYVN